jgi:hypothetical protein
MSDIKNNDLEIIESKNFDEEYDNYEKHMIETIQKYEEKHGEIVAETYNKIYVNKDDYYVWNMIPLTDIQKKYVYINIINGEATF